MQQNNVPKGSHQCASCGEIFIIKDIEKHVMEFHFDN